MNQIICFKVEQFVKRYFQQTGNDFDQTFATRVKPIVFKALFVIPIFYDLNIMEMYVMTTFVYNIIDQLLYIEVLHNYKH